MRRSINAMFVAAIFIALTGCNGNKGAQAKLEQDRAAMRLADAEKQRDDYKAQLERVQAALNETQAASAQSRAQMQDLARQLEGAQNSLAKASSNQAAAEKMEADLKAAIAKLGDAEKARLNADRQLAEMKLALEAAKRSSSTSTPAASTQTSTPELNK